MARHLLHERSLEYVLDELLLQHLAILFYITSITSSSGERVAMDALQGVPAHSPPMQ
jgi:hypothetical protein